MKKRDLEERIKVLEDLCAEMWCLIGDGSYERLRARVQTMDNHLRQLDRETSAPVRPESWRHVEFSHIDATDCICNRCTAIRKAAGL